MLCMILGSCCVTTLYNVFHKVSFLVGVQRFLFLFLQPHQQICERGLKLNKCNLLRVCRADSGVQFVSTYCCYEVILSVLTSESGHPYCLFTSSSLVSLTLHLGVLLFLLESSCCDSLNISFCL